MIPQEQWLLQAAAGRDEATPRQECVRCTTSSETSPGCEVSLVTSSDCEESRITGQAQIFYDKSS